MFRALVMLAALAALGGCSRPSLTQSLSECVVEARRSIGPVQDNDPFIADCMDGRGYAIRKECAAVESPARLARCYGPKAP